MLIQPLTHQRGDAYAAAVGCFLQRSLHGDSDAHRQFCKQRREIGYFLEVFGWVEIVFAGVVHNTQHAVRFGRVGQHPVVVTGRDGQRVAAFGGAFYKAKL